MSLFTRGSDGAIRFVLRVTPRARRDAIDGVVIDADGVPLLKLAVTAPADSGKANRAVLKMLAEALGVPRTTLSIQTGAAVRRKLIRLESGDVDALNRWALAQNRAPH